MQKDMINGIFELIGALFVLNHCRVLIREKKVAGVSVLSVFYFFSWGAWNLWYYPSLEQTWSFYGGATIMIANCLWIGLMLHYRTRPRSLVLFHP